jgi:hypothetical protein
VGVIVDLEANHCLNPYLWIILAFLYYLLSHYCRPWDAPASPSPRVSVNQHPRNLRTPFVCAPALPSCYHCEIPRPAATSAHQIHANISAQIQRTACPRLPLSAIRACPSLAERSTKSTSIHASETVAHQVWNACYLARAGRLRNTLPQTHSPHTRRLCNSNHARAPPPCPIPTATKGARAQTHALRRPRSCLQGREPHPLLISPPPCHAPHPLPQFPVHPSPRRRSAAVCSSCGQPGPWRASTSTPWRRRRRRRCLCPEFFGLGSDFVISFALYAIWLLGRNQIMHFISNMVHVIVNTPVIWYRKRDIIWMAHNFLLFRFAPAFEVSECHNLFAIVLLWVSHIRFGCYRGFYVKAPRGGWIGEPVKLKLIATKTC